jgi:hypothetical protein
LRQGQEGHCGFCHPAGTPGATDAIAKRRLGRNLHEIDHRMTF